MEEKKYVVPEGMGSAVAHAVFKKYGYVEFYPQIATALEAAVRWLSDNPIVPSLEQAWNLTKKFQDDPIEQDMAVFLVREWQKRMFLAEESHVPQEIKDLLYSSGGRVACDNPKDGYRFIAESDRRVLEAYRIGQKAGSK